jgi:hypothetical protein
VESSDLNRLIEALIAQTEAINRLAQSNVMLVQAMAEHGGSEEDSVSGSYLDGRPR